MYICFDMWLTAPMTWIKQYWLQVLAIVALLGALGAWPFAYYQLMNWIVLGAALSTAWMAYQRKQEAVAWLFLAVAVVFNPLAPLYLGPAVWKIADCIAAALFALSFLLLPMRKAS
jgi:hypothetical protein